MTRQQPDAAVLPVKPNTSLADRSVSRRLTGSEKRMMMKPNRAEPWITESARPRPAGPHSFNRSLLFLAPVSHNAPKSTQM